MFKSNSPVYTYSVLSSLDLAELIMHLEYGMKKTNRCYHHQCLLSMFHVNHSNFIVWSRIMICVSFARGMRPEYINAMTTFQSAFRTGADLKRLVSTSIKYYTLVAAQCARSI